VSTLGRTWTETRWTDQAITDVLALRRRGLSYGAIAICLQHFHGLEVNEERVRHIARANGVPAQPRKGRGFTDGARAAA
jgi:hypothetical protein